MRGATTWRDVEAHVAEQIETQTRHPMPATVRLELPIAEAQRVRRALLNESRRVEGLPPITGGLR